MREKQVYKLLAETADCPLTSREKAVLEVITIYPSLSCNVLARHLGCSINTFRKHLANVRTKMGASNQVEVIVRALQYGWINLPTLDYVVLDQPS